MLTPRLPFFLLVFNLLNSSTRFSLGDQPKNSKNASKTSNTASTADHNNSTLTGRPLLPDSTTQTIPLTSTLTSNKNESNLSSTPQTLDPSSVCKGLHLTPCVHFNYCHWRSGKCTAVRADSGPFDFFTNVPTDDLIVWRNVLVILLIAAVLCVIGNTIYCGWLCVKYRRNVDYDPPNVTPSTQQPSGPQRFRDYAMRHRVPTNSSAVIRVADGPGFQRFGDLAETLVQVHNSPVGNDEQELQETLASNGIDNNGYVSDNVHSGEIANDAETNDESISQNAEAEEELESNAAAGIESNESEEVDPNRSERANPNIAKEVELDTLEVASNESEMAEPSASEGTGSNNLEKDESTSISEDAKKNSLGELDSKASENVNLDSAGKKSNTPEKVSLEEDHRDKKSDEQAN